MVKGMDQVLQNDIRKWRRFEAENGSHLVNTNCQTAEFIFTSLYLEQSPYMIGAIEGPDA